MQEAEVSRFLIVLVAACLFLPLPAWSQEEDHEERGEQGDPAHPAPQLIIKGFTDISFSENQDENENTFTLGQFDLFITSALSDKFSFLSEVVYRFGRDNKASFEIERVQVKYSHSDQINLVLGRMHTPLGYWNETYHHGAWFQTTAFRPEVEDSNVLPQHEIGLQFLGSQRFPSLDFEYNISIANGRARTISENQTVQDFNGLKAVNILLKASPDALPGLKFGFNTYIDKIPADPAVPARNGEIDELILGAHLVYLSANIEFLSEFAHISHDDEVSGKDFETTGYYIQGAYQYQKWKPYYRFDYLNFGDGDPYYASILLDQKKHTAGVRFDPILWLGLKIEYSFTRPRIKDSFSSITLQTAFTF